MYNDYSSYNYNQAANLPASNSGGEIAVYIWVFLIIFIIVACVIAYKIISKIVVRYFQSKLIEGWTMFKVSMPKETKAEEDDQRKTFQEMLAVIEPFYANLNSLYSEFILRKITGQDHISLEIIAKGGQILFYVGCPQKFADIILKNLHAQYPSAEIMEDKEYSIFPEKKLHIEIVNLVLKRKFVFPIKSYKNLEEDPLNAITNSMSKLTDDQLAGVQLLLRPTDGLWRMKVESTIRNIQEGKNADFGAASGFTEGANKFFTFIRENAKGKSDKDNPLEDSKKITPVQENQIKLLGEKASKTGFQAQLRIVAVAESKEMATMLAKHIASAYQQLNYSDMNGLSVKWPDSKAEELANYVFRIFSSSKKMILNTEELASVYHMPNRFVDTPNIAWLHSKKLPPPANIPTEGTVIGKSLYRGQEKLIRIKMEDRLRHMYTIGKTGVGKTVLAQNMIEQDIREGHGVCYLDPNGDAAEWILKHIPKERAEDVVYFNPADKERPFGLNMLEWKTPDQRDFLVQESIQIFYKLFDPGQTGIVGPQFEHWMRNAALTLMANPDGGTLIDIPRLFTDPDFEKDRVKYVTDPVVRSFWEKQMAKTADFHKSEMLNYFTSKFGRFMTNDMMRNIIGQTKSSFDFREIMDNKKILICNLSKGMVGEINAFLLGMIIVSKIAMGAFSRQDVPEKDRTPFFLYVDEFQNFITDVFATILSESRKYKLGLYITNQYVEQLDEKIRAAVVGNAGTLGTFRIGAADAEFFAKEFEPLQPDDLVQIDKFNLYVKMLIDGAPTKPFNVQTIWPENPDGNAELGSAIKELSRLKFGRAREIVETEILERSKVDVIDLPGLNSQQTAHPSL